MESTLGREREAGAGRSGSCRVGLWRVCAYPTAYSLPVKATGCGPTGGAGYPGPWRSGAIPSAGAARQPRDRRGADRPR